MSYIMDDSECYILNQRLKCNILIPNICSPIKRSIAGLLVCCPIQTKMLLDFECDDRQISVWNLFI